MTGSTTSLSVRLHVLGLPAVIDCPTEELAARLRRDWSRCLDGGVGTSTVAEDRVARISVQPAEDLVGALYLTTSVLTVRLIEMRTGSDLMLHACGLSDADGNVLILVGPSGTGKTTAASVLSRATFGYVTDETVAITPDWDVLPYEKPLSILETEPGLSFKTQKGPEELGLQTPPLGLRAARLVLLERDPRADQPVIEALPLIESMVALLPQTSALPSLDRPLQRLAALHDECGGGFRLRYSEIGDSETLLTGLLSSRTAHIEPWEPVVVDPDASGHSFRLLDGGLAAAEFEDAIRTAEEVLVMSGGVPRRLLGIATTVWDAILDRIPSEDLVDAVVAVHGDHAAAERIVADALDALIQSGLVVHGVPLTVAQVLAGESPGEEEEDEALHSARFESWPSRRPGP